MKNLLTLSLAILGSAIWSGAQAQATVSGLDWLNFNNGLDGQRYSSLREITTQNARQLGEVCRVQIDGPTAFHAGLIVDDGVIYATTGRRTVAVDAVTCDVKWTHDWPPEEARCGGTNRGAALLNGRLFRGTCDGRRIALDARSGTLLWQNVIASPVLGESTSAAPLAWQNLVFMGTAGSELGVRGRVMAYDAVTGHELWRFHTIPLGDEIGAETWSRPETAKTGGGGIWGSMSVDLTTGELFVPVGNPWPDIDVGYRPGENLFTNSVVVLDAFTGKLKWWYQVSPGDWKDMDIAAAPVLYRAARARDLVAIAGKDGYVTVVDRDTRQLVFRTAVTTIADMPARPSREGTRICPGFAGGVEWNGPALDRLNGNLITGAVDICFLVTLQDKPFYEPGQLDYGGLVEPVGPITGWVTALDSETGAIRWQYHAEKPVIAGVTPTAGGVTFTGDLAGNFLVFDSANGRVLHQVDVGGAMAGGVVTYDIAGKQYVALAAGNISRNAFGDVGLPSIVVMTLNPTVPARKLDATVAPTTSGLANGRRLYTQVCASCHGAHGDFIANRTLSDLPNRMDLPAAITAIKDPKAPMPKLYPDLLDEQGIADLARYLFEEL
ncbi:MAG: PQQ-binding-like beta-propeller repeat protein [Gammaproteobacteria bacterium]|nr:PQQ-binding-like beta-propeller repeat protein [Gammaproteobacteria bacterium]